jgi:hypothetical protein
MFETEIPSPQELKGPAWLYMAVVGGYFGLTGISFLKLFAHRDAEHALYLLMMLTTGIVYFVRYRKVVSRPVETKTLRIDEDR